MQIIRTIWNVVIDALFPLAPAEKELSLMLPENAFLALPKASAYNGSVLPLGKTRSIFAYKDERVSKLIWGIKYKKNSHSVEIGAYALLKTLEVMFQGEQEWNECANKTSGVTENPKIEAIIIPIPITIRRRRERGYNQCELLLDAMQKSTQGQNLKFKKDLLMRIQHNTRQTLKMRRERLDSARDGIFAIDEDIVQDLDKKQPVIVIDDVITTGVTMKQALDTLRQAGFLDVRGLSLAH